MTDNEFEIRARQEKVELISAHARTVHESLKAHGALGEHSTPWGWIRHPNFNFDALRKASGAKHPCSPVSYQMVLDELKAVA